MNTTFIFQNNNGTLVQIVRIPPIFKTTLIIGTYNNVFSNNGWGNKNGKCYSAIK